MASTQPMGLYKKYWLLKEILSGEKPEKLSRKYRCSLDDIAKFKVATVKFDMDFPVNTAKVHFSSEVQVMDINENQKKSQPRDKRKVEESEDVQDDVEVKKQKKM